MPDALTESLFVTAIKAPRRNRIARIRICTAFEICNNAGLPAIGGPNGANRASSEAISTPMKALAASCKPILHAARCQSRMLKALKPVPKGIAAAPPPSPANART